MSHPLQTGVIAVLLVLGAPVAAHASEEIPGASLDGLLSVAKANNPDYAGMRYEAQAAAERVTPAGALPDPRFRTEWMDVTGLTDTTPTAMSSMAGMPPAESSAGNIRYTLMQDLPWFGKRGLKRDLAQFEAEGSQGKALSTWSELVARIKTAQAQRYFLQGNEKLTQEILGLIVQLEEIAQSRYANGLSAQQDSIRAQIEQTGLKNELVALESERHQVDAGLNALLARPSTAPLAPVMELRGLPVQLDPAALEDRLRDRNPQLLTEDARIKAAAVSRDLTYKNRYPDFVLSVSPTQAGSGVKEWSVMLELNIPLQQSSRRAQERESEAMLSAAQSRKQASANLVLAELSQNLAALNAAQRTRALVMGSLLPQAQLSYSSALASYENGKLDFATLLEAQRQIRQAKQGELKAQLEAQMRLAEIEKLLGEDL